MSVFKARQNFYTIVNIKVSNDSKIDNIFTNHLYTLFSIITEKYHLLQFNNCGK